MKDFLRKNKYNIISLIVFIIFFTLGYYGYKKELFDSVESFRSFVLSFGPWAFVIFFIANIMSVIVPFIPGGVIQAFGVVTFGPIKGIIYNYISICIGSVFAFLIARTFGQSLVLKIFGDDIFNKYKDKLSDEKYEKFLRIAILLPIAPDNFLSYLSGLSKISFKKFALIIFLCKPPALILYSLAWYYGIDFILNR